MAYQRSSRRNRWSRRAGLTAGVAVGAEVPLFAALGTFVNLAELFS